MPSSAPRTTTLSGCIGYAVRRGWLTRNPCKQVEDLPEPAKSRDWLTQEQARTLMEAAEKEEPFYFPIWAFLLATGCRWGEARALQWRQIEPNRARVVIDVNWPEGDPEPHSPKSNKIRAVPLIPALWDILRQLPGASGVAVSQQRVFRSKRGGPASRYSVRRALGLLVDRLGLPPIGLHGLRHSFAGQLVSAGAPLLDVQKLLGHCNVTVTQRYAHLAPGVLSETVSKNRGVLGGVDAGQEVRLVLPRELAERVLSMEGVDVVEALRRGLGAIDDQEEVVEGRAIATLRLLGAP